MFVGGSEAAVILGFGAYKLSRWKAAGRLPPPIAELRSTPVWLRADIEALAAGRELDPTLRRDYALVGLGETADVIGMDKSQLGRLRRDGRFPEPIVQLLAGPIWELETIERWRSEPRAA